MSIFQMFVFYIKLHLYRRALAQEPNAVIYSHLQCSEAPKNPENVYDVIMLHTCWSHFYNLVVKNLARKFKVGMRDVIIELSNKYSGLLKILKKKIGLMIA